MTEQTASLFLTVERTIPAPIDAVFDAWLNAETLKTWMTPGPGMSVPRASTDPRVGGRYVIVMKAGDREILHEGEYQTIDRPNKLVFTWVSAPAGNTIVTIDFHKLSDKSTKVRLTHERLGSAESRDGHQQGWVGILEALERAIA
jgi:uncharacterized protein YndB with AHSA1/START domain